MTNGTPTPAPAAPRKKIGFLGCLGVIVVVLIVAILSGVGTYNKLNTLDQDVREIGRAHV